MSTGAVWRLAYGSGQDWFWPGQRPHGGTMAEKKSMISQLQSVGEDALGKLASNDVARSALQSAMKVKERAERSLTGSEEVERRLDAIEKRLAALEGTKKGSSPSRSGGGKSEEEKSDSAESAGKAKSDSAEGTKPKSGS